MDVVASALGAIDIVSSFGYAWKDMNGVKSVIFLISFERIRKEVTDEPQ
jgi:hypothetical protein